MFRIAIEEGKPEQTAFMVCDNSRCMANVAMQIPPGTPDMQAINTFFQGLRQGQWLLLPHGHFCPNHKHAFMEPVQRSLIIPVGSMQGMRN